MDNTVLFTIEALLGEKLSPKTIDVIAGWREEYGFSWELTEYIAEYCANDKGIKNISYMDKVAKNFYENGLTSAGEAKTLNERNSSIAFAVIKSFGITGRNLADAELEFINRWRGEYGFDSEVISEACNRTILKIQKPSFEYADKIIKTWHEKGVNNLGDIEALDKEHMAKRKPASNSSKPSVHKFEERNTDYSQIEKLLLNQNSEAALSLQKKKSIQRRLGKIQRTDMGTDKSALSQNDG